MPEPTATYVTTSDLHRALSDAETEYAYKLGLARLEAAEQALTLTLKQLGSTPVIVGDPEIMRLIDMTADVKRRVANLITTTHERLNS